MSPQIAAMLELLRDAEEIHRHCSDAAIAQQMEAESPQFDCEEWLAKCRKVKKARASLTRDPR